MAGSPEVLVMTTLFDLGPLGPLQVLALFAVVVIAAAGAVYFARKHHRDPQLPDAVFWDGFAGVAIVAPAVLVPALASPGIGLLLGGAAVGAAAVSYRWAPQVFRWQAGRTAALEVAVLNDAAAVRHRSALDRWQRYELDPGYCIDYPAMSDPAEPHTAELIRAMRSAELLRGAADAGCTDAAYSGAVDRLEQALAAAERAAGVRESVQEGVRELASLDTAKD